MNKDVEKKRDKCFTCFRSCVIDLMGQLEASKINYGTQADDLLLIGGHGIVP